MSKYQILTDSASDIPTKIRKQYNIDYYPMGLVVDGEQKKADLDFQDYSVDEFYSWLIAHRQVRTSLITVETFTYITRRYFEQGIDVIYLGCSTALTGSINSFNLAKEMLLEEFPNRKMIAVPTYAASVTLGMMVVDAAREQQKGATLEELVKWVEDNRFKYNQFCTVDTLSYLKVAGRVKGTAAFFGNIIGVKPVFISDRKGNNFVVEKVKGTKASLNSLFDNIKEVLTDESKTIVIAHSCCLDRATLLKTRFMNELGYDDEHVIICDLGPIVGTTCGPKSIATFVKGKEVTRYDGDGLGLKNEN